jgi:hypothetical protein
LKYLSAIPVVFLSSAQRIGQGQGNEHHHLNSLWILALLINSFFSYYWDVVIDWSLARRPISSNSSSRTPIRNFSVPLRFSSTSRESFPILLRPHRLFPSIFYYFCMVFNFAFRFLWTLRLSSHVPTLGLFSLAELLRRFMWCFIRIEREWLTLKLNDSYQPLEEVQREI